MKKYIIAFTMSALVLLTGCEDFLDRRPYGQFTADQLTDETVDGLLASAYAGLFAHYFGNNEAFAGPSTNWIFDVRSDDAHGYALEVHEEVADDHGDEDRPFVTVEPSQHFPAYARVFHVSV